MSEKNFMAYGDAESVLTGYANRIKQSPTTFVGTQAQWNALSSSQKAEYELVDITDDSLSPSGHVDWESNGEIGAKNLLENEKSTQTISGVTFTVNSDGSVLADGTATDIIWFQINNGFKLNDVEYTLTGCPIGGGENTYEVQIRSTESSSSLWQFIVDRGDGATGLCSSSRTYIAFIGIKSGVTVTNLLFKPMLRLATDSDSTYQPYAMTNKELTKQVAPIDDMNNILGAKNLLPNHNVTQVIDGITFTVNNDGTVTATGTSTALVVFDVVNTELLSPFKLNSGTYILTDGLTASQYEGAYTALTLKYTDDTVEYNVADTSINKNQFTVDASTIKDWYFGICIRANKTVNITFKPMVRPASIKDATYVPYSKTNSELTVGLSNLSNIQVITAIANEIYIYVCGKTVMIVFAANYTLAAGNNIKVDLSNFLASNYKPSHTIRNATTWFGNGEVFAFVETTGHFGFYATENATGSIYGQIVYFRE